MSNIKYAKGAQIKKGQKMKQQFYFTEFVVKFISETPN